MRRERNGRSWCGYCGFGPCRSTARTAKGHDLALFAKHHPGLRNVADSVHCDTQPTTMTTNHPEEGQP